MCIVAIAHRASGRYPLIVAANRDERHVRPSAAAHWWEGSGCVLAGLDLVAHGTWLGVTGAGRFAAVTNIFEPGATPAERSRGGLVTGFLSGRSDPFSYAAEVANHSALYGPFNLVLSEGVELAFVSSHQAAARLDAGIHVFSNNAPGLQWTKVGFLAQAIERSAERDGLHAALITTLSGPDARGPVEAAADSLFVVGEHFGTRCTTVLTVDEARQARFIEVRFDPGGETAGRSEFEFRLTGATDSGRGG